MAGIGMCTAVLMCNVIVIVRHNSILFLTSYQPIYVYTLK